jgi:hypothetical protein
MGCFVYSPSSIISYTIRLSVYGLLQVFNIFKFKAEISRSHKIGRLHYVRYLTIPLGITLVYVILVFIGCFPSLQDAPLANENIGFLFFGGSSFKNVPLGLRADAVRKYQRQIK